MPWSLVLTLVLTKPIFSKGRIKNQSALGEVGINLFRLYFTSCVYSFDRPSYPSFFFKEAEVHGTAGTSRQDSRDSRSEVHEILHEIRWNFNNGAAQAVRLHLIINGETCM